MKTSRDVAGELIPKARCMWLEGIIVSYCIMFWVHEEMRYLLLSEVRVLQSGELREERWDKMGLDCADICMRVPWCSGSHSWLVIRGLVVRVPPGAYAPRQGILLTVVSLDPGVVNGYRQESIPCLPCAPR